MNAGAASAIAVNQHGLSFLQSKPQKWDVDVFINEFQAVVTSLTTEAVEFDMINVDCTFANALRRILIAEVPSFAIDRVYLHQNTSVIADETFCHRLGLVPLNVDAELMGFSNNELPVSDDLDAFDPNCHLIFDLDVKAERPVVMGDGDGLSKDSFQSVPLYSSSLKWVPLPGQEDNFRADCTRQPGPINGKILLNKLAVGDEIQARCLAVKGVGRDHAKFSPVSAAFYKLLPSIEIRGTVRGELAKKLQRSFAKGVINVDPRTQIATVADPRLDNGSREHLRHPELADLVHVFLNPRHFIFTVETIAPIYRPPDVLVKYAIDVMLSKCAHYLAIVERPDFSVGLPSCPDVDVSLADIGNEETRRTTLNGRVVGLDVLFVSPDLRRGTFRFTGEDHTLGAALRYCILRSETVKLCGYCQPHPLEDTITFEIQSRGEPAVAVLRNGLYCLRACFEHIKRKFKSAVKKVQRQNPKSTSSD
uniref:RPOLD domain-containing protein n=1 Tax=Mesocestoides corti TaxID=53468 RepID=A0A5K3EXA2_MESCO